MIVSIRWMLQSTAESSFSQSKSFFIDQSYIYLLFCIFLAANGKAHCCVYDIQTVWLKKDIHTRFNLVFLGVCN